MMERAEILSAMADLKLFAMRAACDEPRATAVRRQHEPQRVASDLLAAGSTRASHCAPLVQEQWRARARSNARSPSPGRPSPARSRSSPSTARRSTRRRSRDLARGEFLKQQRNVVLVGGTGTGKTHISVAIARAFAIGLEPMAPQWLTPQRGPGRSASLSNRWCSMPHSSTSWIWSTSWKPRPALVAPGGWPNS
jgi:hypothetical protein